jgi:ribonuclease T1
MKLRRVLPLFVSGILLCLPLAAQARGHHPIRDDIQAVAISELPPEARETLRLINQGGPFPYARDGVVFSNREHRLPPQPRGYYHEYTVKTPGSHNRGPRRIICGELPDCFYTADHYRTFRRITGEK